MNIIVISREFGSGGKELAQKLAYELDYDFYNSQIISHLAEELNKDDGYVDQFLDKHKWNSIPFESRNSYARYALNSSQVLVNEMNAIEKIAEAGHNFVVVGKNADVFLEKYNPLTIFVCADMDHRVKRCMDRAIEGEDYSEKQTEKMIKKIDKVRAQTRDLVGGNEWGKPSSYDLCVNTTKWDMDDLAKHLASYAKEYFK